MKDEIHISGHYSVGIRFVLRELYNDLNGAYLGNTLNVVSDAICIHVSICEQP